MGFELMPRTSTPTKLAVRLSALHDVALDALLVASMNELKAQTFHTHEHRLARAMCIAVRREIETRMGENA